MSSSRQRPGIVRFKATKVVEQSFRHFAAVWKGLSGRVSTLCAWVVIARESDRILEERRHRQAEQGARAVLDDGSSGAASRPTEVNSRSEWIQRTPSSFRDRQPSGMRDAR